MAIVFAYILAFLSQNGGIAEAAYRNMEWIFVYKYPGTMIEYAEGKQYDFKYIPDTERDAAIDEGWSLSPADAEAANVVETKAKK